MFLTDYSNYDAAIGAGMGAAMAIYYIILLAICVVCIVAEWKIFVKAGEPGWACIVPFYSSYVLCKIAMGNGWLFLITLIPFVGSIFALVLLFKLALAFGKGVGYGLGLLFLTPIFMCMLAFGDAEYVGA